ncbi:LysR family transcriptional regulator [Amphibacillus cookii]|uniref:LysR family transcriptional regulator n=1 Tax=Amphibacillus cookii TaxID=767787 RepID=UPI00195A3DBC|nr:LysR family transcriptional regulator [Amphibacillus cookii]MBM7541054.1 DNA-binding transcriptional LysR family regulator [Amphibacillus cookii]
MHIEKIKYFIDLVKCRNFTETAKLNYVSQTTISQQIASLEKTFGVKLIDRNQIPIEPTQAGWVFYNEANILWKQYNHMKEKINQLQYDQRHVLNIEYATLTDIQGVLQFIPSFKQKHPNIELKLNKVPLKDIATFLEKGLYDLAISVNSEFYGKEKVATCPLYSGNYCAVVSRNHPLFHHETLTKAELYQHPLIMLNSNTIGNSYDLMIQHAIEDGYQPHIVHTVEDVETELFHIVTDNVIGFLPDNYLLNYPKEDIRLIAIKDTHHTYQIQIGYLKENTDPALKHLIKAIHHWFSQ